MRQEVKIECGSANDAYHVILTGTDLAAFKTAGKDPNVIGKEGEELVAAILAAIPNDIYAVARIKDGLRNDGPNGEPAQVRFGGIAEAPISESYWVMHMKDGQLIDIPGGPNSCQFFYQGAAIIDEGPMKSNPPIKDEAFREAIKKEENARIAAATPAKLAL